MLYEFSDVIEHWGWKASRHVGMDVEIDDTVEHLMNVFHELDTVIFVFLHVLETHVY